MRTIHRISYILFVIFIAFALSGCGVSKDEHEKTVTELQKTKAELEKANAKIAKLELEKANAKIAKLEKALAGTPKIDAGITDKLRSARQKAIDLGAKVKNLTAENSVLNKNLEKLKAMFADLQKKIQSFQAQGTGSPLDLLKKR